MNSNLNLNHEVMVAQIPDFSLNPWEVADTLAEFFAAVKITVLSQPSKGLVAQLSSPVRHRGYVPN